VYTADSTGCEDFNSSEMGDGHGGGDGGAAGEFLGYGDGQIAAADFEEVRGGRGVEKVVEVFGREAELDAAIDEGDVDRSDLVVARQLLQLGMQTLCR